MSKVSQNQIRATGKKVILVREKPQEKTEGGIDIPERGRAERPTCVVVAVGPEVSGAVVPGDRVVVPSDVVQKLDGSFTEEGEPLEVVHVEEIIAIL